MSREGVSVSYSSVIHNHLMGFVGVTYLREDATVMADTLWALLDPWLSDDIRKLWRRKCAGDGYKTMMWKIRVNILALYEIEAIPKSTAPKPQETLVNYEYTTRHKEYGSELGVKIAEHVMYKQAVMRYLYLFTELIQEGSDLETLTYMADLGYAFCTPYLSYEEAEHWREIEQATYYGKWRQFVEKLRLIIGILDRESILFARRVVDTTSLWEEHTLNVPDYSDQEDFNQMFYGEGGL